MNIRATSMRDRRPDTSGSDPVWRRLLPPGRVALIRLSDHVATYGPLALRPAASRGRDSHPLIEAVTRSGLTGRGGAGFPTGRKLQSVAARRGRKSVVVNATESEPYAGKDRTLSRLVPHLILDGAEAAAQAVGADEIVVVAHRESSNSLERAIAERSAASTPSWRIHISAPSFVSGEETALVDLANGGRGLPTTKPPRPYERGVGGRPTFVVNAETAANIALIARHGPGSLRANGTPEEPGTMLFSITGAVARAGIYEAPIGSTISELLRFAGSPEMGAHPILVGGFFGAFLPGGSGSVPYSRAGLAPYGTGTGAGIIYPLGPKCCGLSEASRIVDYLASQSAGQCGPCVFGLKSVASEFAGLVAGRLEASPERIARWSAQIRGRGACSHPDGTVNLVASALTVFRDEVARHARGECSILPGRATIRVRG